MLRRRGGEADDDGDDDGNDSVPLYPDGTPVDLGEYIPPEFDANGLITKKGFVVGEALLQHTMHGCQCSRADITVVKQDAMTGKATKVRVIGQALIDHTARSVCFATRRRVTSVSQPPNHVARSRQPNEAAIGVVGLHHITLQYRILHNVALYCIALHCVALHCDA